MVIITLSNIEKENFLNFIYHRETTFKKRLKYQFNQYFSTDNKVFRGRIATAKVLKGMLEEFRREKSYIKYNMIKRLCAAVK